MGGDNMLARVARSQVLTTKQGGVGGCTGDERTKAIIEAQLTTMKGDIVPLRMAAPQASIIHGPSRPASDP